MIVDFFRKQKMRRSKRKASVVATQRLTEAQTSTAADASAVHTTAAVEDVAEDDWCEGADLSDDENDLHVPCNIKTCKSDENSRFVVNMCFES